VVSALVDRDRAASADRRLRAATIITANPGSTTALTKASVTVNWAVMERLTVRDSQEQRRAIRSYLTV
jgi:hypothetical protein